MSRAVLLVAAAFRPATQVAVPVACQDGETGGCTAAGAVPEFAFASWDDMFAFVASPEFLENHFDKSPAILRGPADPLADLVNGQ
eukprot:gene10200-9022_t